MKRGFTLVEMLVVVVVIAALTTIVFRLAGVGRDVTARSHTVARLQRIENALSGYYAAFGVYPPVRIQGSRDIYNAVDATHGVQLGRRDAGSGVPSYSQVEAACRAQPFGAYFPFAKERSDYVTKVSEIAKKLVEKGIAHVSETKKKSLLAGFDDGYTQNPGRFNNKGSSWWGEPDSVQLWKYGVMSYLLPRYMFMMQQSEEFLVEAQKQWTEYNKLPSDPADGSKYSSWRRLREDAGVFGQSSNRWKLDAIPSQAACMRWMPNFEGICAANFQWTFWGTKLKGGLETDTGTLHTHPSAIGSIPIYSPGGEDSTSQQYVLDVISVNDGWGREFFYYSPAPYQSYQLWSAGSNGKTFPPWVDLGSLNQNDRRKVLNWMEDDIKAMKN